jgi:hypothetical protein
MSEPTTPTGATPTIAQHDAPSSPPGGDHGSPSGAGAAWNVVALAAAVLLSGALGLAAYAKFTHPNKAKRLFESADGADYVLQDPVIAGFEVAVILALLLGHRLKLAWVGVTLMFGGFAGYALFYLLRGESCGCFGELFTPPIWLTFAIDIVAVGVGVGLLAWRGVRRPRLGGLLLGAVALAGVGFGFASATAPMTAEQEQQQAEQRARERVAQEQQNASDDGDRDAGVNGEPSGEQDVVDGSADDGADGGTAGDGADLPGRADGFTAPERLLRSDLMADIRRETIGEGVPAYYVFVHDPDCPTCAEKMVFVEQYAMTHAEDDQVLRVADFEKLAIERATRDNAEGPIRFSAWRGSPVVFVVRQGRVTNVYRDETAPRPGDVRADLEFDMLDANFPE